MNKQKADTLTGLMESLSASSVEIQKKFDAHNKETLGVYEALLANTGKAVHPFLPQPQQLAVKEFEVSARIEWAKKKQASGALKVVFQNLSADLRYSRQSGNDSRVKIQVQRVPHVSLEKKALP